MLYLVATVVAGGVPLAVYAPRRVPIDDIYASVTIFQEGETWLFFPPEYRLVSCADAIPDAVLPDDLSESIHGVDCDA